MGSAAACFPPMASTIVRQLRAEKAEHCQASNTDPKHHSGVICPTLGAVCGNDGSEKKGFLNIIPAKRNHAEAGKVFRKVDCTTLTPKKRMLPEPTVAPPAPTKKPRRRRRQAPPPEGYFIPEDLDMLPPDIIALFM